MTHWQGRSHARVLLALLLLSLLAVTAWRATFHAVAPAGASTANAMTAVRIDGGLRLSISVPRWRFFRDELVPVTLVLSNRSGGPIQYAGQAGSGFAALCYGSVLNVTMTRDGQYISPRAVMGIMPSCPAPLHPYTLLAEGKSLRLVVLLAPPVSGLLTLTTQAQFAPSQRMESPGLLPSSHALHALRHIFPGLFRSAHAPFAAGWPSLTITVSPHIPPGRTLLLARHGHSAVVRGDPHALRRLMAQESSEWIMPQGTCATGAPVWSPLSGPVVHDLSCPGTEAHEKWQVLVGAPGYAVTGAVYCFNPVTSRTFGGMLGFGGETSPPCTQRIVERPA